MKTFINILSSEDNTFLNNRGLQLSQNKTACQEIKYIYIIIEIISCIYHILPTNKGCPEIISDNYHVLNFVQLHFVQLLFRLKSETVLMFWQYFGISSKKFHKEKCTINFLMTQWYNSIYTDDRSLHFSEIIKAIHFYSFHKF